MLNVLLGGEGMIGRALTRRLRAGGEPCVSYDLVSGFDLRQDEPPDHGPDAFYWFLAWDVGGSKYLEREDRQSVIWRRNLALCDHVFAWLARRHARFLFTSSQLAGRPDAYGRTKLLGEQLTERAGGQIAVLWNVYDAGEVTHRSHVIPDLAAQALSGSIRLRTQGRERRRFLYSADCAEALVRQRDGGHRRMHIAGPEWVRIIDVAHRLAAGTDAAVIPGERPGQEYVVDPVLGPYGWQPRVGLQQGLDIVLTKMRKRVSPPSPEHVAESVL